MAIKKADTAIQKEVYIIVPFIYLLYLFLSRLLTLDLKFWT